MSDTDKSRRLFQETRLRHNLALKSRRVEQVLDRHDAESQVAGGRASRRSIVFELQASLAAGREMLSGLKQEVMAALGVDEVRFSRENGRWQLLVEQHENVPVALLDLLPDLLDVEPITAVLGILSDGAPILLDMRQQDMSHILIAGGDDAGKSALLQTIGLSLAWLNRQSQLQLVVVHAGENGRLAPFDYLPHLLTPVLCDLQDIVDLLHFLSSEIDLREKEAVDQPAIVVLIDDLDVLLNAGGAPLAAGLGPLVQRGVENGIYLAATASDVAQIDDMFLAHFPVRLLGQLPDAAAAAAAAGVADTQAEYLLGQGDFMAVAGAQMHRFQAAYLDQYDFHLCLDSLHRAQGQVLLAQPLAQRARWLEPDEEDGAQERPFLFDGEQVELVDQAPTPAPDVVVLTDDVAPAPTQDVDAVAEADAVAEGEADAPEPDPIEPEPPRLFDDTLSKRPRPAYGPPAARQANGVDEKRPSPDQTDPPPPEPDEPKPEPKLQTRRVYRFPRVEKKRAAREQEQAQKRPFIAPEPVEPTKKTPKLPVDDMNQDLEEDEPFLFFEDEYDDDDDLDVWFADDEGGA